MKVFRNITCLLFSILCIVVYGQDTRYSLKPYPIYDGLSYQNIYFFKDNKQGWILGELSKLLNTKNGGLTWKEVKIPVQNNYLKGLHFSEDERVGWITGGTGTILITKDGGNSWIKPKEIQTVNSINSIYFSKNLRYGIAVGTKGSILLSYDSGETWIANESVDISEDLRSCYISENGKQVWVFGDLMDMYISNDGGKKWTEKFPQKVSSQFDSPNIYSVVFDKNKEIGFAACEFGYMLKTEDGGQNWQKQKIDKVEYLRAVHFDSSMKYGWTVSSEGQVFQTTNSGKTWQQNHQVKDSTLLLSVWFSADQKLGWICGANDLLMNSIDSGKTWNYKATPSCDFAEFALDKNGRMISATDKGIFVRDFNKQEIFKRLSPANFSYKLNGIDLTSNTSQVWAVGDKNIIVTCNSDASGWSEKYIYNDGGHLNSIKISQEFNFGVAVGSLSKVVLSFDGGQHWKVKQVTNKKISFSDVFIGINSKEGWIVGDKGTIYYTPDIGKKWSQQPFIDSTQYLINVTFEKSGRIGYIASRSFKTEKHLYKTINGGRTWDVVENFPENTGLQHVEVNPTNGEIVASTLNGNLYRTIDDGKVWFLSKPRATHQALSYIQFDKRNNIIVAGDGGTLLKGTENDKLPVIEKIILKDSSGHIVPSLLANDPDTSQKELDISINIIKGDLIEGTDDKYHQFITSYGSKIQVWPTSVFSLNKNYTIRFAVSDGWNIVYKDTTVRFGEPLWSKFKKFMHWHEMPKSAADIAKTATANLSGLSILYAVLVLGLFAVSPIHYVQWHEAVASSRIPLPEKLSKYLVLFFIEHDRCLDAFVTQHRKRSLELFESHSDVNSRPFWVAAPFEIDNQKILGFQNNDSSGNYVPGLQEVRSRLRSDRVLVSIEGQGGVGKSSIAFQLARWASETEPRRRLFAHMALPIFVNTIGTPLDDICINRLAYITDSPKVSETLSRALLRKKRIVAIVDGISEFTAMKRDFIDPDTGANDTYCVIYTSRKPINLPESTVLVPSGLKIEFLDNLLDGFTNSYVGAYKFGEQREILRSKVKEMISELNGIDNEKPVPLSILRIMVERASVMIDQQEDLINLPNTISHLLDSYVADLFRNTSDPNATVRQLRKAALISLGMGQLLAPNLTKPWTFLNNWTCRPQWTPDIVYATYLDKVFLSTTSESGIMITSGSIGDKQMKFTHDPIAEYLASKEIIIQVRDHLIDSDLAKEMIVNIEKLNPSLHNVLILVSAQMRVNLP